MTPSKIPANTGSGPPVPGEPEYLVIGFFHRPHGVSGEILLDVLTDFQDRLQSGIQIYVGEKYLPMIITSVRGHSKGLLITLDGIDDREAVGKLRNQYVYVLAVDRPSLPEGKYYHHQLIGLSVVDKNGTSLGKLTEILETGANDVYVVRSESGKEILLPAIPSVVLDVNQAQGRMRVHLLPGLIDEME